MVGCWLLQVRRVLTMCGISGYIDRSPGRSGDQLHQILRDMTQALYHRGPDSEGYWVENEVAVGFGHRRLAIIDRSSAGHQPMHCDQQRWVLNYNGEIYNFHALRAELESLGAVIRGHSDTEIVLSACSVWGPEEALKRLNGMFAFALWDRHERVLYLARDRFGEKPLYYGWLGNAFVFASELKAFRKHPEFVGDIDRKAVNAFFERGYIPAPWSIFAGISKLPPASYITVAVGQKVTVSTPVKYWSAENTAREAMAKSQPRTAHHAVDELEKLLHDSVGLRMVADVPLGALLSGGVDSSAVVAMMQTQSSTPVKTFSVGYEEADYNEAHHAKAVARHLGTDHTELEVTSQGCFGGYPDAVAML